MKQLLTMNETSESYRNGVHRDTILKSVLRQTQVNFMGHMITTEGGQSDQSKVEAILNMPAPTNVKFLPNLASDLQPI